MNPLASFWRDERAATTAEFALMVPTFMLFVFGAIDVGGFAWKLNRLEKATQMGTRLAVVTNPVAQGLLNETYVGRNVNPADGTSAILQQGDPIPAAALGKITCNSTASCTCTNAPCITNATGLTADTAAFSNIVDRMQVFDSSISDADVSVEFTGSGLGFAGDPEGMEIVPLVTVRLNGMQYQPIIGVLLGAAIDLPDFAYTLPMEDGSGTTSN
jgi:Flp pilus assembly protein TadG